MSAFVAVTDDSLTDRVEFELWWLYGISDVAGARYHCIVDGADIYTAVELADGTVINSPTPWTERDLGLVYEDRRGVAYQLTAARRRLLLRALARSRELGRLAAPKEATP